MAQARLVSKTQGGEANPSNFGLQNMILATDLGMFKSCLLQFKSTFACCCMLVLYVVACLLLFACCGTLYMFTCLGWMHIACCLLACSCCISLLACLGCIALGMQSLSCWSTMIEVGAPYVCLCISFDIKLHIWLLWPSCIEMRDWWPVGQEPYSHEFITW